MDAQDFRSLQEAYNQVHQLDEAGKNDARIRGNIKSFGSNYTPPRDWDQSANRGQGAVLNAKQKEKQRRKGLAKSAMGEAVDLYDIILTHLLDEGYAETEDAVQAIMVNMSEEWRESIVEEVFDEALTGERYKKAVKKPGGTAYSRMVSADPKKRATRGGRGGESDFGAGDRGSGNKAARRAGTYKDKED